MNTVLLLDVSCRPLRVIPVQRAVTLLLSGRAEPLTDDFVTDVRSETSTLRIPSVMRLGYAVTLPFAKKNVPCTRRGVLARDGHVCQFVTHNGPCNATATTIDHIHPKSKGGDKLSWTNLTSACAAHNHKKADKTLKEMGWSLKGEPVAPRASIRLAGSHGEVPASWAPFLTLA